MELYVNPISYKNALELYNLGVKNFIFGIKDLTTRNYCLKIEDIIKFSNNNKGVTICLALNSLYFDKDIHLLEEILKKFSSTNIFKKSIIFADFAICQIVKELKIKNIDLIYNPETLVTNPLQFNFYLKNNIKTVSLSRELSYISIKEIAKNKKNMKLQMCVCGYQYMMDSRWDLISNFKKSHDLKINPKKDFYYIKESKRNALLIINEDSTGTHIYSSYNLNLINNLKQIKEFGIDSIRIDTYLHSEDWIIKMSKLFLEAMKTNKSFDLKLIDVKELQSPGFFTNNSKDLIYLEKNININEDQN